MKPGTVPPTAAPLTPGAAFAPVLFISAVVGLIRRTFAIAHDTFSLLNSQAVVNESSDQLAAM